MIPESLTLWSSLIDTLKKGVLTPCPWRKLTNSVDGEFWPCPSECARRFAFADFSPLGNRVRQSTSGDRRSTGKLLIGPLEGGRQTTGVGGLGDGDAAEVGATVFPEPELSPPPSSAGNLGAGHPGFALWVRPRQEIADLAWLHSVKRLTISCQLI